MKPDKNEQTKADLLRELESLREQLSHSENGSLHEGDIPLLLDRVEAVVNSASDADDTDTAAQAVPPPSAGQQSLFGSKPEEQDAPRPRATATRSVARGENPFLPRHIRDRLDERRQLLADDIAQASSFFSTTADNQITPEQRRLIDELVAEYLPRIEQDLRARLRHKLKQNPSADDDR